MNIPTSALLDEKQRRDSARYTYYTIEFPGSINSQVSIQKRSYQLKARYVPISTRTRSACPVLKQNTAAHDADHVTGIDRDQGKVVTLQKTQPSQLTLWQTFLPSDPRSKDTDAYSNTAELYDAVPKSGFLHNPSKRCMSE